MDRAPAEINLWPQVVKLYANALLPGERHLYRRLKLVDNSAVRDYLARTFQNEAVLRGPLQ